MPCSVDAILNVARKYLDAFPVDPTKVKQKILDDYNSHKPSSEYKMKPSDPWCAAFVGACAGLCNAGDIIPISASCDRMITGFRTADRWCSYCNNPQPGYIIFYDWDKNGTADHVGIVEAAADGNVRIIEGNMGGRVGQRIISVDYALIEGYGIPSYVDSVAPEVPIIPANDFETLGIYDRSLVNAMPMLKFGSRNVYVTILQSLLTVVGDYNVAIDGEFGPETKEAVIDFQKTCALEVDGIVGKYTWAALLV